VSLSLEVLCNITRLYVFTALQCVVRAFRREKEHGKENISKAAKRRRDRIFQVFF
jgi:hypothetical protein